MQNADDDLSNDCCYGFIDYFACIAKVAELILSVLMGTIIFKASIFVLLQVKGAKLRLWIYRGIYQETGTGANTSTPFCSFVNLELKKMLPRMGAVGARATVLLENPRGDFPLTVEGLKQQVCRGLQDS